MKKAGIVVGTTLIVLAVVIFWLSKSLGGSETGGEDSPPVSSVVETNQGDNLVGEQPTGGAPSNSNGVENSGVTTDGQQANPEPVVEPAHSDTPVDREPTPPSKTFLELDESQLGEPSLTKTEIMVVADKRVVLLDGSVGTKENKQLVYSVGLLDSTNNTKFSLYLNKGAYDILSIGDKVKVEYLLYTNDIGTEFPAVITAEKVE